MATSWTLTLDVGAATAIALDEADRLVVDTTRRVLNRAIVLTPVKTGNLRGHNQSRVRREGNQVVGEVFNDTEYADAVHDGFPAHTIRPKPGLITVKPKNGTRLRFVVNGKVVWAKSVRMQKPLRFVVAGKVVYAQSVNMPARRGRPWLLQALREIAIPAGFTLIAT